MPESLEANGVKASSPGFFGEKVPAHRPHHRLFLEIQAKSALRHPGPWPGPQNLQLLFRFLLWQLICFEDTLCFSRPTLRSLFKQACQFACPVSRKGGDFSFSTQRAHG